MEKLDKFDFNDKTILVVEDTETSIRFFDAALKRTNAKTLFAEDGDEAIKLFDENEIDLVLLDLNLFTTSGFDVLRHIRSKDNSTPVIVQTAYILSGEEQISREMGANDFMAKPIKLNSLLQSLNKFLQ
ncbi:MAG: response regulator [Bacteroidales bacterium]|nr:response regulator [Bacteroidales bacterium]